MPTGATGNHGELNPTKPEVAVRRAEELARRGRLVDAARTLVRAMERGASRPDCLTPLARIYRRQGLLPLAVETAEAAVAEHQDKVVAHRSVVRQFMEMDEYDLAAAASRALLRRYPDFAPALEALAESQLAIGEAPSALRAVGELVRLDPLDPGYRVRRALLSWHVGMVNAAVDDLERVLDLVQDDEDYRRRIEEHLDLIEGNQIYNIMELARRDHVFLDMLQRDMDLALMVRAFRLSGRGRSHLGDWMRLEWPEPGGSLSLTRYH